MVQGGVLFIALGFSIVNLLVDILYAFIDPRIKSQYRRTHRPAVASQSANGTRRA
jgi:peptide/nickel transport system permease protein